MIEPEEAWTENVEFFFKELCDDHGIDHQAWSFHLGDLTRFINNRLTPLTPKRAFFIEGPLRTSTSRHVRDSLAIGTLNSATVKMPRRHVTYKFENSDVIEKRINKIIACIALLTLGIEHNDESFNLPFSYGWMSYIENAAFEPDYSFLSILDLNSERDCLAGLLYFASVVCQNDMNIIHKVFSQEELLQRSRLVGDALTQHMSGNLDYKEYPMWQASESILFGISYERKNRFSIRGRDFSYCNERPYSLKELKETAKFIRFICEEEDGTKYGDYIVPSFSFFSVNEDRRCELKKSNLKKLSSEKIISKVLNGKTRTEIINEVFPTMAKLPTTVNISDAIDAIENISSKGKEENKTNKTTFSRKNPLIQFMGDISQCLDFFDAAVGVEGGKSVKECDLNAIAGYARSVLEEGKCFSFEHPLLLMANMLVGYVKEHPDDSNTFHDCLNMSNGVGAYKIFNFPPYERFLMLDRLRKGRTDEEAVSLIASAIRYHAKKENKKKKLLSKTAWKKIAENKDEYDDMPYEWIYGVLS